MKFLLRWLLELLLRFTRSLDLPMLAVLLALMVIGLATQYSASNESVRGVTMQGAFYFVGLLALWVSSRVPMHLLKQATPAIFVLSLVPMVLVLFIGGGKYGNHWIKLGFFNVQPAELCKLSLPMMLAWHFDRFRLPPRFMVLLGGVAIIALPVGLTLLQRDLGTAVLIMATGVFVLFLAGTSWWWWGAAAVLGGGGFAFAKLAPIEWLSFLRPYQQDRILTFRNPDNDPMGAGWNILQSQIAIGGGGMTGKGWGQGTQSHLNYLPEHTTDFAFSVLSEDFGWVGVMVVLALYVFLIGRCLWIAADSRDGYARMLAGAIGLSLFVYVMVNGGMISGLLPVVGVPMPLISYGGTSAVTILLGFGVVMALRAHRPVHR
ncbi:MULTISPECIES: rod shape-determining protein RodA [Thermomonas]|jgi:rod shape determining protein RodA|uniref:Cell wall polymerase n=1 Tax=Thermomonas beijingensis TaxID=2872701 RepID=A0ABS7TGJ9_9GAMM|nr:MULTISPECIES: rod shape-determining protein RodA [Thermomonas]MBS0459308.1 rod shape-determining protein RodA [Pseudomonadota bacterium]MDE2381638.1 rod shape-determining protein RodA [Xanthomonadaceae bacterium]MBZ4186971.1 rod shape-determining protein RodA [Thermomonas beijingensis]HOC12053.1 rod shape-determining protein RodA [Thermomonas sp.]HQA01974.1 rod shape-determining protein RodA [Thermomonas sp.]